MLDSVDWDPLLDEPDIDHCWQTWQSTYLNIISKCIPKKVLSSRRNLPWSNPSICQAIKQRNSPFKAYKHSGSSFKLLQFKFIRNRIVSEIRKAKLQFFKQLQAVDAKHFRNCLSCSQERNPISLLYYSPQLSSSHEWCWKADILNNQFFSNFNHSVPWLTSRNIRDAFNIGPFDSSNFPKEFLRTSNQILDLIHSLDSLKPLVLMVFPREC